jgi:cell division protein FtsL
MNKKNQVPLHRTESFSGTLSLFLSSLPFHSLQFHFIHISQKKKKYSTSNQILKKQKKILKKKNNKNKEKHLK